MSMEFGEIYAGIVWSCRTSRYPPSLIYDISYRAEYVATIIVTRLLKLRGFKFSVADLLSEWWFRALRWCFLVLLDWCGFSLDASLFWGVDYLELL